MWVRCKRRVHVFVLAISHDAANVVGVSGDISLKRLAVGSRGKIDFRHHVERRAPCRKPTSTIGARATNVRRRNNRLEDDVRTTGTGCDPDTCDTDASTRSSEGRSCYNVGTCLSWLLRGIRHIVLRSRLQLIK